MNLPQPNPSLLGGTQPTEFKVFMDANQFFSDRLSEVRGHRDLIEPELLIQAVIDRSSRVVRIQTS